MAKIFFNDKQSGDSLTATNVNDIKDAINTNADQLESDISSLHLQDSAGGSSTTAESISNGTVSGYYDSNDQFRYNHHIIPESNANFDIGNAEYKVRHLFLSDNSLWVGDNNKITIGADGSINNARIDRNIVPPYIQTLLDDNAEEINGAIKVPNGLQESVLVSAISPEMYLKYAQKYNNDVTIDDIYPPEGTANYDKTQWSVNASMIPVKKTNALKISSYTPPSPASNTIYFELDLDKSSSFYLDLSDNTKHQIHFKIKALNITENYDFNIHLKPTNNFTNFTQNPTVRFSLGDSNSSNIKHYEKLTSDSLDVNGDPDYLAATDLMIDVKIFFVSTSSGTIVMNEPEVSNGFTDAYDSNGNKYRAGGMENYNLWGSAGGGAPIYAYNNNGIISFVDAMTFSPIDLSNITINNVDPEGYVTSFDYAVTEKRVNSILNFNSFGNEVDKYW
jgi:hypothetical protein